MPVPYSAALATFDEEKRKRGLPTEPTYRLRGPVDLCADGCQYAKDVGMWPEHSCGGECQYKLHGRR